MQPLPGHPAWNDAYAGLPVFDSVISASDAKMC
jgi:hypothetical protein